VWVSRDHAGLQKEIGVLIGVALITSVIALSACDTPLGRGAEEVAAEQIELELDAPDQVLKTLAMPLDDGKVLKLFVIGKRREDIEMYGVREVRVYEGNSLLQSIIIQEAIDAHGVDGIDEGYSGCVSAQESAALRDVNFDGYMDLEVCGWVPNNSIPYYYWCWNDDSGLFEYSS